MNMRRWFALVGLLVALAAGGCADRGAVSDDHDRPVFYGGVTGGHTSQ
jgi:hypothetical protein